MSAAINRASEAKAKIVKWHATKKTWQNIDLKHKKIEKEKKRKETPPFLKKWAKNLRRERGQKSVVEVRHTFDEFPFGLVASGRRQSAVIVYATSSPLKNQPFYSGYLPTPSTANIFIAEIHLKTLPSSRCEY